jgi:hypothetical protein
MRKWLLAVAVALQWLPGPEAHAQLYFEPQRRGEVRGVGCYWYRGQHYCNRYCYREVDGYVFCQPRLRDAGSQAPPPVWFYPLIPREPRSRRQ